MYSPFVSMVASIVMDVTYGIHAKPENDPYIEAADRSFHEASIAALPNSYWVNVFPLLKHVPDWMPGEYLAVPEEQYITSIYRRGVQATCEDLQERYGTNGQCAIQGND